MTRRLYLDTSAAGKLLVEEAESRPLAVYLDTEAPALVACVLLETELRRLAAREGVDQQSATEVLDNISLYEVPRSLYQEAGLLPGRHLRSLDAVHLAAAIRLGVDGVVAYDQRLADAARSFGLNVLAPAGAG